MASLETAVVTDAGVIDSSENEEDEDFFDLEEEFEEASSKEVFDPLSGYNRIMTSVNDKFYFWLLKPVANGYKKVVPLSARRSVTRFFNNLLFPLRFVNNVLQLKFKRAGIELTRFGVNTTVGILGLGDPAKNWFNLEAYPEDFGQTLGHYGLGGGFHIVLPLLGPSNLRDVVGLVPDYFMDPVSYIKKAEEELAVKSFNILNEASHHIGEYESIKKDALDLYPFLRDAYEQNRKKKVRE
ncbi:MAG: VacJ family lipoprotein [Proteobacteria bacterium]|nr:VacJ family lipoprotein [Pseudomonadota bacterium]